MARPRSVSDEELIEAALEILIARGPKGLTFESLAQKVGLVPAALVRRFTSKQNLLLQIDRFALERSNTQLEKAMAEHDSPIEAIIAGFVMELSFATSIERYIHGQEYLLMDLGDKTLYANYHTSFHQRHQRVVELIKKAQARGEISANLDAQEYAQFLQTILHGVGQVWAMDQKGTVEDYINHYVRLALKPYQTNITKPQTKDKDKI